MRMPFAFFKAADDDFDPASLTATGYLIDYAGEPWEGTASAGTSGDHDFIKSIEEPGIGADFGTHPSADFTGDDYLLGDSVSLGDLIDIDSYTFDFIVEMDDNAVPTGSHYDDPCLLGDVTNGEIYVTFTDDGVRAGHYDGLFFNVTDPVALGTGTKASVQVVYDGADVKLRVNAGLWETVAADPMQSGAMSNVPIIGAGYAATNKINGRIARWMTFDSALDESVLDALYANAQADFEVP